MMKSIEKRNQEPTVEGKPCVYGKEIVAVCPVRGAFPIPDPMKKYKLPRTSGLDEVKEVLDMGLEALDRDPQQ